MRGLCWLAVGVALAAPGTGCDRDVTYSYFDVGVTLDRTSADPIDDELLAVVEGCAAVAENGDRRETADLHCVRGSIPTDLGTFQYTTKQTTGTVTFSVTLKSYWGAIVARGESPPIGIVPGNKVMTSLVVKALPNAPRSPNAIPVGSDDASLPGPDGAAPKLDAAPGSDAGGPDGGVDGGDAGSDAGGGDGG
jgi:hypothetical protein